MLWPLGKAVVVQEIWVGTWRFLSAAWFFCSHVGPLHGPLKGVPVPAWAPPQATVPSGVSLLQCGEFPSKNASPAVVPFSRLPCAFLSTLSSVSSCAFFCLYCHWQLLPFSDELEWGTGCLLGELEGGRQWVYGAS